MQAAWLKQPDVYNAYVDQRQNVGSVTKQNVFIVLKWQEWEQGQATSEERAEDMKKNGCGGLTARTLEKRASRLGLKSIA